MDQIPRSGCSIQQLTARIALLRLTGKDGSYADRRSVSSTTTDALRTNRWQQRAEFFSSHPVQEPPHLASFIFKSWAGLYRLLPCWTLPIEALVL